MPKVSELPGAAPLDGTEEVPVVQAGALAATSIAAIAAKATARFVPFLYPDQLDDGLRRVVEIELYETVDGVDLAWPSQIVLRECARDELDRARIRIAGFDGVSTYTEIARESVGGAAFISMAGQEGVREYPLFAEGSALGVPAGTEIGRILVDVTGAFGTYVLTYPFSAAGLAQNRLFMSTAQRQRIEQLVRQELIEREVLTEGPFVATVTDTDLMRDIDFAGGWWTQGGHRYGFSSVEIANFPAVPQWRAVFVIRDFTTGVDVARGGRIFTSDPSGQEHWIFCHQSTLPDYTGKAFLVRISADAQWPVGAATKTFTLYSQAGFRPETCATVEDAQTILTDPKPPAVSNIISASGGDFTSLRAAHDASYNSIYEDAPEVSKYSTYPNSESGFARRLGFEIADDGWNEEVSKLVTIPFSTIAGRGMFSTRFYNEDPTVRVFERTWSGVFRDFFAEQFADQYLEHNENANGRSIPAEAGEAIQNFHIFQLYLRVWYRAWGNDVGQGSPSCIGQGTSDGQIQRFVSSVFEMGEPGNGRDLPAIFMHNSTGRKRGGLATFEKGTVVRSNHVSRASLQLIGSFGQSSRHEIYVEPGCTIENGIQGAILMPDNDPGMPARARDRWPYVVRGVVPDGVAVSDPKMRVLEVDAGTQLTGSEAAINALFGRGYSATTGRGEALTLDGSTQALATKLTGLSGSTVTLSRSGVANETVTIGDHAGESEGQVLAALNAQLTNFAIQPVRIDGDIPAETPTSI